MKAVIMAGGLGTRLSPITEAIPKPCVPIVSEPCILRAVRRLAAMGIQEFHISLFYLPDRIKALFSTDEFKDLCVRFYTETSPLGTAGSVKHCLKEQDGEFLVLSADGVFDFDLSDALRFHRRHNGPVTVLTARSEDPGSFGVLLCEDDGRITRFVEKPDWAHAYSDEVNTGIYLCSPAFYRYLPEGPADFSRDVFPRMLRDGIPIYRYPLSGYWCDVGTVPSYLECNFRLLEDRTDLPSEVSDKQTVLIPPCYVGKNVTLNGCRIGPYAIIGDGCELQGACVERSVLHDSVRCDTGVSLRNAVVCNGSVLREGVRVGDFAVIGASCDVGANTVVSAGVRIFPSNRIPARSLIRTHVHRTPCDLTPDEGKILFPFGKDFCGSAFYEIGRALASVFGGDVAVGRKEQRDASCVMTLCGGILASGNHVHDMGVNELSRFRFALRRYPFSAGAFVQRNYSNLVLRLYDGNGMPLSSEQSRRLQRALSSDWECCGENGMYRIFRGAVRAYDSYLRSFPIPDVLPMRVSPTPILSRLLPDSGSGTERMRPGDSWVRIENEAGDPFREDQIRLAACIALGSLQNTVPIPEDYPLVTESVAKDHGFRVLRVSQNDADYRKIFPLTDPNVVALLILNLLSVEKCTFSDFVRTLPPFAVKQRDVAVSAARSSIMRALSRSGGELSQGIRFRDASGSVRIIPKERSNAFRIVSEAAAPEIAEELCDYYSMKLKGLNPD